MYRIMHNTLREYISLIDYYELYIYLIIDDDNNNNNNNKWYKIKYEIYNQLWFVTPISRYRFIYARLKRIIHDSCTKKKKINI